MRSLVAENKIDESYEIVIKLIPKLIFSKKIEEALEFSNKSPNSHCINGQNCKNKGIIIFD